MASEEHDASVLDMIHSTSSDIQFGVNNKTYTCQWCSKVFRVKHQFVGHLNTHMNRKPFRCEFCDQSYAYSTNLSRHRRTCESNPNNALAISKQSIHFKNMQP